MALGILQPYGAEDTKPRAYDPAYGGVPQLPKYVTDTSKVIGPDIQAQMIANLPGYQSMLRSDVTNIGSNLAGRVPTDVLSLLQQQAAERGVATGIPGSQNVDAAYLRALGLTSLQLQQLGHSQLTEAMQRTPIQQMQTTTTRRDLGAERAVYAAAPEPAAAAAEALRQAQYGLGAGRRGGGGITYPGGIGYGGGGGLPWWERPENQSPDVSYPNLPWVGALPQAVAEPPANDWWNQFGPGAYGAKYGPGQYGTLAPGSKMIQDEAGNWMSTAPEGYA